MIIPIPAPQRLAPTQTLFAAAQTGAVGGDRWGEGVTFVSNCGPAGLFVPVCGDPTDAYALDDLASFDQVVARAFVVWAGARCGSFSGDSEIASTTETARGALEIDRHRQLEAEFWSGTIATAEGWEDQPFLTNTETLVEVDDSGLPLVLAFGSLAAALADCALGRGMIHVSRRVMAGLVAGSLVRREGTQWRDPFDNLVVAGAGYDGSGPDSQEWMYATGPVEARFGDVFVTGDQPGEINRDVNLREVRAQQFAGAWFDPCCHLGVAVDLCATECPAP